MTINRSGRRGSAAFLAATVALATVFAGAPEVAQQVAPGAENLRYRLDILDAELADIRARLGGVAPAPGFPGAPAAVLSNSGVAELEGELRRLTSAVEELQNQVRRIGTEAARRFSDIEFRLTELEGGDVSALQPVEPLGGVGSGAPAAGAPVPSLQTQELPPVRGPVPGGSGSSPAGSGSSTFGSGSSAPAAGSSTGAAPTGGSGIALGPTGQGSFGGVEVPSEGQAGGQQVAAVSESERGEVDRAAQDVRQGRYDQAEDRLRRFLNARQGSPLAAEAWYWLGESQFVRGQHGEAARSFLTGYNANRTGPRAAHNLYRLGVTLGRLGQVSEACLTLREVRTQFPDAPDGVVDQADAESDALACG